MKCILLFRSTLMVHSSLIVDEKNGFGLDFVKKTESRF